MGIDVLKTTTTKTSKKWSTTRYRCSRECGEQRRETKELLSAAAETAEEAAAVWVEENSDSVRRERKALHSQVVNTGKEE